MRSSVSVILSNPPPDTTMSYPDYSAHPHHHHALLVLVRQVGTQLKSRYFHKLYERISRVTHVKVNDSSGKVRPVWISFRREYPVENNDWGDFQAHRRVLGIISVGQVGSQSDLNDVCRQHESLKVKYSSTLYDSRCIILGLNPDGTVYHKDIPRSPSNCSTPEISQNGTPPSSSSSHSIPINGVNGHASVPSPGFLERNDKATLCSVDRDSGVYVTPPGGAETRHQNGDTHGSRGSDSGSESTGEMGGEEVAPEKTESPTRSPGVNTLENAESASSLQPPTCFKTRALFYPTADYAVNIENQIHEFISSLFWVLEYKRMDKSQEKPDKPQLLCAPFERKDLIGLDLDSRTNKKKCMGRLKKHLADLSLQVGLPVDALTQYSQAVDILKGCNDWLWLAASYEGLCSTSVMMLYPHLFRNNVLQRYSSLGVGGSGSSGTVCLPTTKLRNTSGNSNSLPTGLDPSLPKQTSKYCLSPDDIVEKYRESIVHYSKYRNAGVVETEASIKAVHVLIEQRRYLVAAEFLSNVVFINLQLSDEEKIVRFNALSDLYHQIGFHRKASFFRRVAAMRCVAPQNQDPNWSQCYRLLLLTLEGYRLSLDPVLFAKDGRPGWPALQTQILEELVGTSRRMGEHGLCTRHQAFLLSAMLPSFTYQERLNAFTMLEAVSAKSPSGPSPLVVADTSIIIPPVNFINIPFCRYVKVMPPSKERKVELRDDSIPDDVGPFIFSPFQSIVTAVKAAGKIDCEWVEGDVSEVMLAFHNPMHFQLKLNNMMLITEGIEFEPWTSTVLIEADSEAQLVSLRGRPQEAGELRILGYSFCCAGVSSNCRFKALTHLKVPFYFLNVVPALPCVQIFCDSSSSETGLVSDGGLEEKSRVCVSLNAGETQECNIVIHNVSSQAVDCVEVSLDCHLEYDASSQVFEYSLENLRAQLPIPPGGRASLTLYVYASSEFLLPGYSFDDDPPASIISGSEPASLLSSVVHSSLPSRQSTIMSSLRGHRAKRAHSSASNASSRSGSSLRSGSSGSALAMSSMNAAPSVPTPGLCNRTIEGSIRLSYTGGKGMESKYWRVADVGVSVEVVPSLLVTRWDALPAERPNQCYVVLDLLNSSSNEMDLQYTPNKHILVQGGESCRVPIPIDRCPIAKLNKKKGTNEEVCPSEVLGDHVASLVELRWVLGPSDTPGRASLRSLTFPPQTHHLITMAPIHWDVKLNEQGIESDTENIGKTGDIQCLTVGVSNASGDFLPPLTVFLTAFQDHQNGTHNYRLDAKMTTTGATKFGIPKLAPDESFSHECGLIFFTAGVFKIEVSGFPSDSSSPIYGSYSPIANSSSEHYHKTSPAYHTWKLAPPIELTILDS